jgi:fatty acid desaturase
LLQVQHWSHHRRNRTAPERGEFIHGGERAWGKILRYYASILGGLWLVCFLFPLIVPILPFSAAQWIMRDERFNYLAAGFDGFNERQWRQMQLEGIVCYALWGALFWLGPWHWQTLVIAYAAFAFSWSSLQWVYHLYTPLHKVEGAYNLRAPRLVRWLFLNFNCNLIHHRHPSLPWQEIYGHTNRRETQPLWYRYLYLFRPPVPMPQDPQALEKMLQKHYF